MNVRTARWLLIMIFMLVAAVGCSPAATPSSPATPRAPASQPWIDYVALEAEIEKAITTGPVTLDNVRRRCWSTLTVSPRLLTTGTASRKKIMGTCSQSLKVCCRF
jgi:hypothetical protein